MTKKTIKMTNDEEENQKNIFELIIKKWRVRNIKNYSS